MGRKAVFITTKNLDYLRNVQEIELLGQRFDSVKVIGSSKKSYVQRLAKVYIQLLFLKMGGADEIFVGFAPQLVLPFWKWKLRGKKVTIDFFISLYDTMVFDRKKFKQGTVAAKILKKIDQITLGDADRIIADTKAHGEYFCREFGADKEKMEVLYLNADTSVYYPRKQSKPENYKDKFVVLYFGSILPLQGIQVILKALELLKDDKTLQFEVIGPIQDKFHKVESGNITYIPWLEQKKLAEHIAYADLCLAGHFDSSIMKAKRTIPGKAYIYRAMGKPMILGDNPATHELYSSQDEGIYFVPMGDGEALADKIKEIQNMKHI